MANKEVSEKQHISLSVNGAVKERFFALGGSNKGEGRTRLERNTWDISDVEEI